MVRGHLSCSFHQLDAVAPDELGFDAEMDLYVPVLEPRAAALRELGRLRDFRYAERARVKLARDFFLAGRHRQLHVIDARDAHIRRTPQRDV
jgi:hypothetical protein